MRIILILAGLTLAAPAVAQDAGSTPGRDSVTIGGGAAIVPRYEGSSDYIVVPAAAARGTISGIGFTTIGTALYVDLIPRHEATGGKFVLGPVVHIGLNRTSDKRTRDPQIVALGKVDTAIDLGGQIGYSTTGVLTSDYDTLSFGVAATYDVAGAHSDYTVTPSATYGTPLSRKIYVAVSAGANYVGDKYARTYFGINNAQFLASGLPTYTAKGGFKDVNFGALANLSLTGDLRHGLSLFALGNYSRLLGDFKRSPVTRDAGQWYGGAGLAYTF